MARKLKTLVLLAILVLFGSGYLSAAVEIRFGGGLFRPAFNDLNTYLADATRFKFDSLRSANYAIRSSFEEIRKGQDYEFSLAFPIAGNLGLEIGAGYLRASKNENKMSLESSFSLLEDKRDISLASIPVFLGLDYGLPVGPVVSVHAFASGGLFFTRFKESGEEVLTLKSGAQGYSNSWTAEASAVGYGLRAGLGCEVGTAGPLSLIIMGGARYARVAGFKGKSSMNFGSFTNEDDDMHLYYYEFFANYPGDWYGAISLPNSAHGSRLRVFRDAAFNFSGFFIRAGLSLKL